MAGFDTIIVGGGLHGCSTALHLAIEGAKVLVLDKDHSGRHASGVNAGGVRRLGRDFREVPLAIESLKLWQAIEELVDDACGFHAKGHIQLAETEEELRAQRQRVSRLVELGYSHERIVDRSELRDIVPAAANHCVGGIYVAEDGAAMPYQTTAAFRRKAASLGVVFRESTAAQSFARMAERWSVTTSDGDVVEAPHLVVSAGAWSGAVCQELGEPAPVIPIAPMLMITAPMDRFVEPVVGAAKRVLSFKQYDNGTVMIGGGLTGHVDMVRNRADLNFGKLATNARTACDLFPIMSQAQVVRAWAGIEARMPDDVPVIGPSLKHENLFYGFGFSAHGFQLGPIVGRVLAALVRHRPPPVDIAEFSIGRFAVRNG